MYFFLKRIITYLRLYLSSINQGDPQIQKLFAKSDNASCYHGNYLPQALYQLCKEQDIMLVRYDYNEPCKGKDQCDCECVGLKTILKSYVDSVNNAECANDIFIALNQSKGLKNKKIAVIEIDKANHLYQEIQFLISAVIIPFNFLLTASYSRDILMLVKVLLHLMVM